MIQLFFYNVMFSDESIFKNTNEIGMIVITSQMLILVGINK